METMNEAGREIRTFFPVLDVPECNRRLAAAKVRRAERRELWAVTFGALARDPDLRAAFAAGVRADVSKTQTP